MTTDRCPNCGHTDIVEIVSEARSKHGLDENPAKQFARCMGCESYLLRPAGRSDEWLVIE